MLGTWLDELRHWEDAYGNTAERWLLALGVFVAAAVALRLVKALLNHRSRRLADASTMAWPAAVRGLVERTRAWFLFLMAAYAGSLVLQFPENVLAIIRSAAVLALLLQAAIWGNALLNFAVVHYSRERLASDAASATTISALGFLGKLALWVLVVLVALDNLGVNVTALVAGLGIGGIAVALAAQNILGDLFASLSIMLDRPFVLGDFIAVGEFSGTVEHIGMKTTRLRSLSGEQLVFSNNDLLQSRIRNYKRMTQRRVVFTIGVTYETARAELAGIAAMIREIIESQSPVRFDRAHLRNFGDSAIMFEAVYFVLSPDYGQYMDIQQAINLALYERFQQRGIEFAYPTQTVYLRRENTDDKRDLATSPTES